jgi:hypothetical protein
MPSDPPEICEGRRDLLRDYCDAVSNYAQNVRDMADLVIAGEEVRANETRRISRTAWDKAEKSRLALYRHEADHGCTRSAEVRNISES